MKSILAFLSISWLLFTHTHCNKKADTASVQCDAPLQKGLLAPSTIKGMSLVAPRHPWVNDPLVEMTPVNINWVALLPYRSFEIDRPRINFEPNTWWGETVAGISESVRLARAQNIKVMIKPQLWSRDLWVGAIDYATQAEWDSFHLDYTRFICEWAQVADSLNADLFCIGTEVKNSAIHHPTYWQGLIDSIRQIYSGPLTYAPNWDEYNLITFWDKLDYIGIDAYFPLLEDKTPTVCALKEAWKPVVQQIERVQQQYNKPVLFTEWGYLTLDGCTWETWVLEKDRGSVNINQQAQANACQALLETFGEKPWWAGGFQWKWYPDLLLSTRTYADDYSPQNKLASQVLQELYE